MLTCALQRDDTLAMKHSILRVSPGNGNVQAL
jgi:hypothetical protein